MRDRRVGEHPLHVALGDRGEVPDRERGDREHRDGRRPDLALLGEGGHEDAQRDDEARTFVAAAMNAVTPVGAPW